MKAELEVNGKDLVVESENESATCNSELCDGMSELIVKVDYTEKPVAEIWLMKPREDSVHIVDHLHEDKGNTIKGKVQWNDFLLIIDGKDTRIGFNSKRIPGMDFARINIPAEEKPQFTVSGFDVEVEDEKHKSSS